jgi:hypothetical protein
VGNPAALSYWAQTSWIVRLRQLCVDGKTAMPALKASDVN